MQHVFKTLVIVLLTFLCVQTGLLAQENWRTEQNFPLGTDRIEAIEFITQDSIGIITVGALQRWRVVLDADSGQLLSEKRLDNACAPSSMRLSDGEYVLIDSDPSSVLVGITSYDENCVGTPTLRSILDLSPSVDTVNLRTPVNVPAIGTLYHYRLLVRQPNTQGIEVQQYVGVIDNSSLGTYGWYYIGNGKGLYNVEVVGGEFEANIPDIGFLTTLATTEEGMLQYTSSGYYNVYAPEDAFRTIGLSTCGDIPTNCRLNALGDVAFLQRATCGTADSTKTFVRTDTSGVANEIGIDSELFFVDEALGAVRDVKDVALSDSGDLLATGSFHLQPGSPASSAAFIFRTSSAGQLLSKWYDEIIDVKGGSAQLTHVGGTSDGGAVAVGSRDGKLFVVRIRPFVSNIDPPKTYQLLRIAPNPSTNTIQVIGNKNILQGAEFILLNMLGEIVLRGCLEGTMAIPIFDLPDGQYILSFPQEGKVGQFIKLKR